MSKYASFDDYINRVYENEIYERIKKFMASNRIWPESNKFDHYNRWELDRTDIKHINIYDQGNMKIGFHLYVEATIYLYLTKSRYDDDDDVTKWFLLDCEGSIDKDLKDFKINDVKEYTMKPFLENQLNDSLVPIIRTKDLDKVAADFLRRNFPEALNTPMYLDPLKLIEKMGLRKELHKLSEDGSIFGQIYFRDDVQKVYDNDNPMELNVERGTILIDSENYFLGTLGSLNNTMVHECVHWDLHSKAFEFERIYKRNISKIECVTSGDINEKDNKNISFMEWQANALTPKILMPINTFKSKAFELIKKYKHEFHTDDTFKVINYVIQDLSDFFGVSIVSAKIRMIEAGYEEARAAFEFVDGSYIRTYKFKPGSLKDRQTFTIGAEDLAILVKKDQLFRDLMIEGNYQFIENHVVLNDFKYIDKDLEGNSKLTDYAIEHMDECCLIFDLELLDKSISKKYSKECYLNRGKDGYRFDFLFVPRDNITDKEEFESRKEAYRKECYDQLKKLPNDFEGAYRNLMKWQKLTFLKISEETGLAEKTIREIVKGNSQGTLHSVVLLCLALHVPYRISEFLIKLTPHNLSGFDPDSMHYDTMLMSRWDLSLKQNRDFINQHCSKTA